MKQKRQQNSKIAEAKAKADEIVAQAEADAKKISETIAHKSELDTVNYKERTASSIDLQRRTNTSGSKTGDDRRTCWIRHISLWSL